MKLKAISTVLFRNVSRSPSLQILDQNKGRHLFSQILANRERSRTVISTPRSSKGEAVADHAVTQEKQTNMTTSIDLDFDLGKKEIRLPSLAPILSSNGNGQLEKDALNGVEEFHTVVSSCASCLARGGVAAVPTDTIYGVACLAQNTKAVNSLYDIKQRNFKNPVAISVGGIDDIYRWSMVTVPREILEDLLPGPVTVVFERRPDLNPALNPHTNLIGLRIPNHRFMQALAKECGSPVALTSANISGASSCLQIKEFSTLWPRLDLIINGGTLSDSEESRLGSTVVDLSVQGKFRIIRQGSAYKPTVACLREKHSLEESLQPETGS